MDTTFNVLPAYAELFCFSNFTFLHGASHAEELSERAAQLGYSALAVTDECSLAGVVRAHVAAKEAGLSFIVGSYFRGKLEELQAKHALIGEVRGMGLMQALELVKDRKTKEPAPEATAQVMERARDNGLLIGKGGLFGNVLRLSPMLNISKADVDEGVRLLDRAFSEVRN